MLKSVTRHCELSVLPYGAATARYLLHDLFQQHEKGHHLPRIGRKDPLRVRAGTVDVVGSSLHDGGDHLARSLGEDLDDGFVCALDLSRVGRIQVAEGERLKDLAGQLIDAGDDRIVGL